MSLLNFVNRPSFKATDPLTFSPTAEEANANRMEGELDHTSGLGLRKLPKSEIRQGLNPISSYIDSETRDNENYISDFVKSLTIS